MSAEIKISRGLYPREQKELNELEIKALENRISAQTYTSPTNYDMLEVRSSEGNNQIWHSEDNGETWELREEFSAREDIGEDRFKLFRIGPFYLDPNNGLLVKFLSETIITPGEAFFGANPGDAFAHRLFFQISRDEGKTWEPKQQFIQNGPEYNSEHWAKDVYYKKSSIYLEIPPFPKLSDGTILLPYQGWLHKDKDKYGAIQNGCFLGHWREDLSGIDWDIGGKVYGGGCEQTTAVLDDGRIFNVMRAQGLVSPYIFPPKLRPYTISEDGGKTWEKPMPFKYSDGSLFTSPAAWSRLIRSSKNGKWYWIANILPVPDKQDDNPPKCDPRHPLQIAELDTETLGIKKETVTIIEDKAPDDPELVRFSNFQIYEDRKTKDFILLMMKSYSELTKNWLKLPRPNYRYRISLPD